MTDLATHIQQIRICDTHEHLRKEEEWVKEGPADVLQDLFQNYVPADLISAGATDEAVQRLTAEGDVAERFAGVRDAWSAIRHTGYGEAVRRLATQVYGLPDDFSPADLAAAQPKLDASAVGAGSVRRRRVWITSRQMISAGSARRTLLVPTSSSMTSVGPDSAMASLTLRRCRQKRVSR